MTDAFFEDDSLLDGHAPDESAEGPQVEPDGQDDDLLLTNEVDVGLREAQNGLLQFDHAMGLIEAAIASGHFGLRPELVCSFQEDAVRGIRQMAGQYRRYGVEITNTTHVPPAHEDVAGYLTEMCDYVRAQWRQFNDDLEDALHLAAYVMWRINWIHPFTDGNGRTARIVSYVVLSIRLGFPLRGKYTIPDQIADNREPYFRALVAADEAWDRGGLDVSAMKEMLGRMLEKQLQS